MQLFSLGHGTVSLWSIVPHCLRVLQVLLTISDSSSDIVGRSLRHLERSLRHCWKHLQHPGTALNNAPWGHCPLSQGAKLHFLDRSSANHTLFVLKMFISIPKIISATVTKFSNICSEKNQVPVN